MNYLLLQKQKPFFEITKSLNQYPNIKAQTSIEIEPLENYENSIVVFDERLLSKQKSNINLFFTRGRHKKNIDMIFFKNLKVNFISKKFLFAKKLI